MSDSPQTDPSEMSTSVHKWTTAVLAGLGVILVLIIIAAVVVHGTQNSGPRPIVKRVQVSAASGAVTPVDYISVSPSIKPGPDGQLHDAWSQTTFYVHAGRAIKLVIHNADSVPHAIVAPAAGVSIIAKPGTHTYTLMVKKSGVFQWHCNQPCDPYSMSHSGYMMGQIVSE